jgi:hypothetical protein
MNERREGQLSTADMVAAGRQAGQQEDTAATTPMQPGADTGQANSQGLADGNGATATGTAVDGGAGTDAKPEPLLSKTDTESLRSRWMDIQGQFVDEPRRAVQDADSLVADLMQRLAQMFADERNRLEQQWDRGDQVSTEDLRQGLRRYRSFFERLLSI